MTLPKKTKITAKFNASLLGTSGMASVFAGAAAMLTAGFTPYPLVPPDFGKPVTDFLKQRPLTEDQAYDLLTQAFDAQLDPGAYSGQQQLAARFYLRSEMEGLPGITQSLLKKPGGTRMLQEVLERVAAVMAQPDFTQLMQEHSAGARRKQDMLYAQEVGAATVSAHAQIKAPPRASFTRNRMVTA